MEAVATKTLETYARIALREGAAEVHNQQINHVTRALNIEFALGKFTGIMDIIRTTDYETYIKIAEETTEIGTYKRHIIATAKQLFYPKEVIEAFKTAKSEQECTLIMRTARERSFAA